jgi:hypothetical protein
MPSPLPLLSLTVEHLKVMAALTVEPAYASLTVEPLTDLMVEHLKVMAALTVEPAYASLSVEPAYASFQTISEVYAAFGTPA